MRWKQNGTTQLSTILQLWRLVHGDPDFQGTNWCLWPLGTRTRTISMWLWFEWSQIISNLSSLRLNQSLWVYVVSKSLHVHIYIMIFYFKRGSILRSTDYNYSNSTLRSWGNFSITNLRFASCCWICFTSQNVRDQHLKLSRQCWLSPQR